MAADRKLIGGRWIRWDDERAAEAYARGWWVGETLADALHRAARNTPHRVALVGGDQRLDCETLHHRATTLAHGLHARLPPHSVVSFMLPNWPEAAVIYLAATLAGMVVNPILPSLRGRELRFILDDSDSRMVFVPSCFANQDYPSMVRRVTAELASPPDVVVLRGNCDTTLIPFHSLFTDPVPKTWLPELDPDAVRMIMYTSGTTGRAKGVLHTHNSIHALIRQIGEDWLIEPGDAFLVPSPIAHIGGSVYAFECPLLLGTTAVLMDRWNAEHALRLLHAQCCTHMAGATPFLEQLLAAAQRADARVPALKLFVCGGASVSPSLIRRASAYFGPAVVTRVYGSTEVPVTTVGSPDSPDHAADTDGRVGLADVKLVSGEILVRGPQMLAGYQHPDDEAGSFDAEGYFRTGDLGRRVDDDYLVITGRAKDVIIRNGENISPKEVEDILVNHPGIAEIAIVGLPDERTGERACAVVVPTSSPGPELAELRSFLEAASLARFKMPEQLVVWDGLPKNDAGKVLKHQIKAALMKVEQ
ncbi:AMP-binding protein [Mycobacterium pseudokansasii]|uniref:Short-chain-fatty-acid--CoA ligase n=1 Tax=Mycobacterium pseudokansasii TaxID=2341080 RepID=A0A498QJW8_9MYCO|nr:AMP-binding protein [Mycobacterium pseudokansasii]KZS65859.1 cyclohexanecarboxylate-CoA ligase [Mycobacterium kansasii]VAZ87733.1 Short-chain-fatty-acid--CoA ligase [Mycobacterium pseudokansasii]VAZ88123.1 Short-chain-fatty-acid--CoA ligase [Mycobacterium pseudokansasii]VBA45918.1 Short-chain-fatty-acid--CoA ligase [Mycobacterium pseudokansasii]